MPINWNIAIFGTGHSKVWEKIINRRIIDLRPFMPNIKVNKEKKTVKNNVIKFGFGGGLGRDHEGLQGSRSGYFITLDLVLEAGLGAATRVCRGLAAVVSLY